MDKNIGNWNLVGKKGNYDTRYEYTGGGYVERRNKIFTAVAVDGTNEAFDDLASAQQWVIKKAMAEESEQT